MQTYQVRLSLAAIRDRQLTSRISGPSLPSRCQGRPRTESQDAPSTNSPQATACANRWRRIPLPHQSARFVFSTVERNRRRLTPFAHSQVFSYGLPSSLSVKASPRSRKRRGRSSSASSLLLPSQPEPDAVSQYLRRGMLRFPPSQKSSSLLCSQVAQTKLVFGLLSGLGVYALSLLLTLPLLPLTVPLFPLLMWVTLRWLEDLTSSLRAALALFRLLLMGKRQLLLLREMREGLRARVEEVAVRDCGLPREGERYLADRPRWRGLHAGFFSLRRRRKKGECS